MYLLIQKIVEGHKFIDWADLIAKGLHTGLVGLQAMSKECEGFPHEPLTEDMTIYQYYKNLQAKEPYKEFTRINDVFFHSENH